MLRLLIVMVLLSAVPAGAQPNIEPFVARRLAPGVHLLAPPADYVGALPGNVAVVEQADGVIVIDSGQTVADGRRVVAFVRSITRNPVKALVYTHWHGDHPLGASEIRAAWPRARIISTARTLENLRGPARNFVGLEPNARFATAMQDQLRPLVAQIDTQLRNPQLDAARRQRLERVRRDVEARIADFPGTYLVLPTETFTDVLLLDDRERPVRLMFLGRANTDGDAIAWLPRERIVVTGDVVVTPTPFGFGSFPRDWLGVIERLKALNYAQLVPGHGEPLTDTAYLDRLAATITDIRNQVAPLARQGLTLEQVRARLDFSGQLAIFGDTPRNRAQFESFWLTPMVESAWKEARGEAIVQGDGAQ